MRARQLAIGAVLLTVVPACTRESGDSAERAADPISAEPELVGPGVISTARNETFPSENPVDGALWFSVYEGGFDDQTIHVAARSSEGWMVPTVAPFSGRWGDRAPRFSVDGQRLYFTSNRPTGPGQDSGDMNIWAVARQSSGEWSAPQLVQSPVSVEGARDIHSAVTADGTMFVASSRPGGRGRSDIFRISPGATAAEHLGPAINDSLSQPDLYVAADGSWMILVITDHPVGYGGDDLYLSRFENGTWTAPRNLGQPINSQEYEYGPTLSRDGAYLYFTSHRRGSADVYRVSISAIGVER